MHRAQVIAIMNKEGFKLVMLAQHKDPPVKELTFTTGIAAHDLTTKLKQVESWLEKKHHVRITLRLGRGETADNLPQVVRDGRAALCILRPPSAKEMSQKGKKQTPASQAHNGGSEAAQSKTVSTRDTTEETLQQ
ncbi:Translation initiation factor IF-3 [Nibea albiflora]|uniref:Translation initiation factor IF-3 n=1 Tax=Nibea albiflora TaxID=240163 RepID=A0ACB7FA48_NIBAL|nr:Translation initiation factor IF-3 [Nibea albiflora]